MPSPSLVLIGFMGSGKTTVGRLLARRVGLPFLDVDDLIARRARKSIRSIFAESGERAFRDLETQAILSLKATTPRVVAVGGGAIMRPDNVRHLHRLGAVIYLHVSLPAAVTRITSDPNLPPQGRPNAPRMSKLYGRRLPAYRQVCDFEIDTDKTRPSQVASRAARAFRVFLRKDTVRVDRVSRPHTITVMPGLLRRAHEWQELPGSSHLTVVTDKNVARHWLPDLCRTTEGSGWRASQLVLPAGERSKNHHAVQRIHDFLAESGARRDTVIAALGGGVIGDLAGFAASSYMRGIPLVQIPTTLVAQLDAAIGGKTGYDHPKGKNLIGAFYQPWAVLVDPLVLRTLPAREFRCGLAEAVKYGAIGDTVLLERLSSRAHKIVTGEPDELRSLITRCIRAKVKVVQTDEFECKGPREALNFGHTFAHALETASNYRTLHHGEAVAIGMVAATRLSCELGSARTADLDALKHTLSGLSLPTRLSETQADFHPTPAQLTKLLALDKKARRVGLRFVLLDRGLGKVKVVSDVPQSALSKAWRQVLR